MMMKIKILGLILTMFLLIATVAQGAIYSPLPINGKVTGSNVGGLQILVTNIRSGKVQSFTTSGAGEFIIDAANFDDNGGTILRYTLGDQFKIQIAACAGNPICEETRTWMGTSDPTTGLLEIYTLFEIGDLLGPEPEPEPECLEDSDCPIGYECIAEECEYIEPLPECATDSDCPSNHICQNEECVYVEPEPEPTPISEIKISTNEDKSIASFEVNYCENINVVIKNSKLARLQDKEIDFDRNDYDIHGEIILKDWEIKTSIYDSEYGTMPYIIVPEEGVECRYVFDKAIPLNDIAYDEPLEIKLCGKDIRIIEAKENSIVIEKGVEETNLKINDKVLFDGKYLEIISVGYDDGTYVYVSYNGEKEQIFKGDIAEVGGIQVLAETIVNYEVGEKWEDFVDLKIAYEIEIEIRDGEDYNDEEEWRWIIKPLGKGGYIAITNQEDYKYMDDDYEKSPLIVGDKIILPNNFSIIKFNEITEPDTTEMNFKVKDNYLYVRGDDEDSFVYDSTDYEILYIDSTGIYDKEKALITTDKIRIGDSNVYLKLQGEEAIIGKLEIKLDMEDISYDGASYNGENEAYMGCTGLIFKDPDGGIDNKANFRVIVPDEIIEATITIGAEPKEKVEPTEPVEPTTPTEPVEPVEPVEEEEEEEIIIEPELVEPEPETKPEEVEEEGMHALYKILISLAIAVLGFFGWGAGFTGLANYYFNKGEELEKAGKKVEAKANYDRAAKMLRTALKRVSEGYYDKK